MNKSIIKGFAALALCGTVALQSEAVESGIVGYQTITIPTGWSVFCPTFKNVDSTKTLKLGDIVILNKNGEAFDDDKNAEKAEPGMHQCRNKVSVRKVQNGSGDMETTTPFYTTNGGAGWGANADVEINPGEGLVVNSIHPCEVMFRVSGEVELHPWIPIPIGWSVIGNYTPVDMTLGDIVILNKNGEAFDDDKNAEKAEPGMHQCRNKVSVRKVQNGSGDMETTTPFYTTNGGAGWGANADVEIKAGEAVVVNNTAVEPVVFKLKEPIK